MECYAVEFTRHESHPRPNARKSHHPINRPLMPLVKSPCKDSDADGFDDRTEEEGEKGLRGQMLQRYMVR